MSEEENKPIEETPTTEKKVKKVKKVKKTKKALKELPDFTSVKVKSKPKSKNTENEKNEGLYTYDELLDRIFAQCNISQNSSKQEIELPQIKVVREGSKRVIWENFTDICKRLHRSPEDIKVFVLEELMTIGSIDAKGGFTIKAKLQPHQLENILIKYVSQFVQCPECKSLDTELIKENRINFIKCNACSSKCSVAVKKAND
ncbi:translation initiation factor 2 beta subunit, putative [Entamoeba histolytica HM-1:IMSS-B]|uniref:Translation initiation factor 2 beta subunit, putative n=9 Tax=Entamoeba TaxID=5758 RepID=C4LSD9_ENTH1|nr:translation initiation factor 2 beta subunit, putative [Entamoeba nuttalli P19]XP_656368.1 translation initiation factor 2 beta subunit, putative [Entamoeba histolytica HM-1:IMSS]EMD42906.1 domain found in IF2B/IF5 domain containing protein [Entamoeba histolytica KU27]EMH73229.1 translation initiation factor 2 beta subunit, putative [Entamoeba histolytica HM-1:IMSS-B]EMS17096.1 domain found in if2b/if5 domain containing protein [Entamoeba histolytica HM-3:IMSS]ENY61292.1 domain found in if2|eukprot:XP_008855054.1 translation initiation factor 2 beta subunit, putative [Entamoeba nuttalli P19]